MTMVFFYKKKLKIYRLIIIAINNTTRSVSP